MNKILKLQLKNSSSPKTKRRWDWAIWLEGEDLSQVESVEYFLHPTFKNPQRLVTDASSQFRLESNGWGEFSIHAKITTTAGETTSMEHWLTLGEETEAKVASKKSAKSLPKRVFLSHSSTDISLANKLTKYLQSKGVIVSSGTDTGMGESIEQDLKLSIGRSDAVVALVSDDPGPWVEAELQEATKQRKQLIPLILNDQGKVPAVIRNLQNIHLEKGSEDSMITSATKALNSSFNIE